MVQTVKIFERADGKARLSIVRRPDGLYAFVGETERQKDGYTFWAPSDLSGLYDSAETAEREAIGLVPWLKRQLLHSN
jgi:hypothetical protein